MKKIILIFIVICAFPTTYKVKALDPPPPIPEGWVYDRVNDVIIRGHQSSEDFFICPGTFKVVMRCCIWENVDPCNYAAQEPC